MELVLYDDIAGMRADTLNVLMRSELENNLMLSIICDAGAVHSPKWLLASVKDAGKLLLVSVCTPPFNLQIYDPGVCRSGEALAFLARELRRISYDIPGVLARHDTATAFAEAYNAAAGFRLHMSMNIMRLDSPVSVKKAPGICRTLRESDMYFAPYWERAFAEDCRVESFDIAENVKRLKARISHGTHFIWEDSVPVSQAVHGRSTPGVAVVNGVYTPPHYRGRGYASSVVAELSNSLLNRGFKCCCLFADAENPVSCSLYRKLGYRDMCVFTDIRFV